MKEKKSCVKNSDSQGRSDKIAKKGTEVTSNRPHSAGLGWCYDQLACSAFLLDSTGQQSCTAWIFPLCLWLKCFGNLSLSDYCTLILVWNRDTWFLTIKEYTLNNFNSVFFSRTVQLFASSLFIVYAVAEFSLKSLASE